ncbi:MAG TPA: hypothetical protein VKB79_18820 [Bryobacteraceae bacterium]|nr:hypothetical protein [Bryobacteraceae bacterium]
MNPDQRLIQSAYEDTIRRLYTRLFESYTEAGASSVEQTHADENFKSGVAQARHSRDRAIAMLA